MTPSRPRSSPGRSGSRTSRRESLPDGPAEVRGDPADAPRARDRGQQEGGRPERANDVAHQDEEEVRWREFGDALLDLRRALLVERRVAQIVEEAFGEVSSGGEEVPDARGHVA